MNHKLPVTLVTGFLGAGKTTLISGLIADVPTCRFGIVVNEFGEISIDDAVLHLQSGSSRPEIHKIQNSLLAYADCDRSAGDDPLREDRLKEDAMKRDTFVEAMLSIWASRDRVDHVIIETSGLAAPTAAIQALMGEQLQGKFGLDATLVVIDTPWLLSEDIDRNGPIDRLLQQQLVAADIAILNKIDALSESELLESEQQIRRMTPTLRFIELAHHGRVDPSVAVGLKLNQPAAEVALVATRTTGSSAHQLPPHRNGHSHSGIGPHDHGIDTHEHLHEHDPGWVSFAIRTHADKQDHVNLVEKLQRIAKDQPVLRAKGFIYDRARNQRMLIQAVRERVSAEPVRSEIGEEAEGLAGELVFIGYHISRGAVLEILNQEESGQWS